MGQALSPMQCRAALTISHLLAPWLGELHNQVASELLACLTTRHSDFARTFATRAATHHTRSGIGEHRHLKRAPGSLIAVFDASKAGSVPASGWPAIAALAQECEPRSHSSNTTSCSTSCVICWRSATTSANAGATRATTICWPRKRDCATFVAIAQGQAAAGELVRARPPAHDRRRRTDAALMERLDVRVPDAAAGHADL